MAVSIERTKKILTKRAEIIRADETIKRFRIRKAALMAELKTLRGQKR